MSDELDARILVGLRHWIRIDGHAKEIQLKGFEHGHVELILAGRKYEADYTVTGELMQLSLADRSTVVADQLPGATYEESAIHVLEQFATGKIRPRE